MTADFSRLQCFLERQYPTSSVHSQKISQQRQQGEGVQVRVLSFFSLGPSAHHNVQHKATQDSLMRVCTIIIMCLHWHRCTHKKEIFMERSPALNRKRIDALAMFAKTAAIPPPSMCYEKSLRTKHTTISTGGTHNVLLNEVGEQKTASIARGYFHNVLFRSCAGNNSSTSALFEISAPLLFK